MRARLLFPLVALPLAACEPPVPPTTERIIRIQIEGCEDAVAPPPTPAPTPTPLAVASAPAPPASVAATTAPAPLETPVAIQTRVPRTPLPPLRTPEQLSQDFLLKREGFLALLTEERLHPLDVPEAYGAFRRADDFQRARNFDEALRYIEVATLSAQATKIGEPFILAKFKRVENRIESAKLDGADQKRVSNKMANAHQAFLNNSFRKSNAILYEVEQFLDQRSKR